MALQLLVTKLHIPALRPQVVRRDHLIARLNAGLHRPLTLVAAPAGFGKTTLVSAWATRSEMPVAWLSLDEGDNDLARFITYVVAALQTVAPEVGQDVLPRLGTPLPIEALLTPLLNDIASLPERCLLVLDDFHTLDHPQIGAALGFLVEHAPPQMHLVIVSREDPPLPLARLRARAQLGELRTSDLRFSLDEVTDFLNSVMGLELTPQHVAALESRTEGWVAGLQMAALSVHGRADLDGAVDALIAGFTGSHRFVLDYLLEEVLHRQPAAVRQFLLMSSVLERLCAPLCDALSGRRDGETMLALLERGNLFLIPLDDQREWYRYHHLFADVLRARLALEQPDQIAGLHRTASAWYEQHDAPHEAIKHALWAGDFDRAAVLLEHVWPAMERSNQSAIWLSWASALPAEVIRARPLIAVGYAWALLDGGELETSASWLAHSEHALESAEPLLANETMRRFLPGLIATARAYRALALGDVPATVRHAQRALTLLPADDPRWRGAVMTLLALSQYASGDLEHAASTLTEFHVVIRSAGQISDSISVVFVIAEIMLILGRLHEGIRFYRSALALATAHSDPPPLGTSDLYRGLSELHREQGDDAAADAALATARALGEQAALPDWQRRLHVTEALMKQAAGDLDGAVALLNEAERLHILTPLPDVRPIAALKARLWLGQGRLAEALAWARARGLTPDDPLHFMREYEHITLAHILIAQDAQDGDPHAREQALHLLARLLQAAQDGGRMGRAVDILVLQASAYAAHDDRSQALAALETALRWASPEDYVGPFLALAPQVAALLPATSAAPDFVARLLPKLAQPGSDASSHPPLADPLSAREIDVLHLLSSDLSGPQIADRLMISLNTLRTHTKNIYSKLGVRNRRAAVRCAQDRRLL